VQRKSTGGYVSLDCSGAVSWKSKKQTSTASSRCEAEYMDLCSATKEAVWLFSLLASILSEPVPTPIAIGVDNGGTMSLSQNPSITERSKHIDFQYHHVRECLSSKKVDRIYVPTNEQIVDFLTKPLDKIKHSKFTFLQGVVPQILTLPNRGGVLEGV